MFSIYLITDRQRVSALDIHLESIVASLSGLAGSVAVQLREKDLGDRELLALARLLVSRLRPHGVPLLVNGRADIARLAGAAGVHLPQSGVACDRVRSWWPEAVLGVSCHSEGEVADASASGADFATFGPVFPSLSKPGYGEGDRLAELKALTALCRLPLFALGGVTLERLPALATTDCWGVAAIGAWMDDALPADRVLTFASRWRALKSRTIAVD